MAGERLVRRLPLPIICPPNLYSLMLKCWSNEPSKRPCFREIQETLCEILMEERREGDETMSRESRRVAAISWSWTGSAGNGVDLPPPKPSRVPATYVGIGGSAGKSVPSASSEQSLSGPTTYLVAPNREVLAQLIRDNETHFSHTSSSNSNPASSQHKSKTKGRKKQPVYANIMMADAAPPSAEIAAAAVATNPAPYKEVRISACRFEQQRTKRTISRATYGARTEDWKLRQQQRQSEEDSRWLGEEESHMVKQNSFCERVSKDRSTPLQGNQLDDRSVVVKKLEPTPTARLYRTHDKVYDATTSVVRAVMLLSQGVDMAHKVLNKVMTELVSALKLDERYCNTTLDNVPQGNAVCSPHFGYERQKSFRRGRSCTHHQNIPMST
ncbi:hypothetical protein DAPPUDRAFT_335547, partial [Daphnia pulex]